MYQRFDDLLKDLTKSCPSENRPSGKVFYFKDQAVAFFAGEMEGIHWMDIHIELKHFHVNNLLAAKKVLQANAEMGLSTPIPTWFALDAKADKLVFINRLDWRHVSCKILEDHILRCIEQMSDALRSEGI
jgi:hypothetical protein